VCVCVRVRVRVRVCHHDYSTFSLCYRGRNGDKIFLFSCDELMSF
jgi:hypothetical protein